MVNHTVTNYVDMVLSHGNIGGCSSMVRFYEFAFFCHRCKILTKSWAMSKSRHTAIHLGFFCPKCEDQETISKYADLKELGF